MISSKLLLYNCTQSKTWDWNKVPYDTRFFNTIYSIS